MPDSISDNQPDEPFGEPYVRWADGVPVVAPLDDIPVSLVPIRLLSHSNLARQTGEDPSHTQVLAETEAELPPIIVHRATMRVIDGMHRVRAEMSKGRTAIAARIIDCDDDTAFLLAVASNIRHGLTLSTADRRAAAERMIAQHPDWSDRAVAVATGLSGKTVSTVRAACSTANVAQLNSRVGMDGRLRPLDSAASRRRAAQMLRDNPDAGLREIARATGLSPATVSDVRRRAQRGEDPVPDRYRRRPKSTVEKPATAAKRATSAGPAAEPDVLLAKLRNDPALRYNETGRQTLRWLYQHMVDPGSCQDLASSLPEHWSEVVAELALSYARTWRTLADKLHDEARRKADTASTLPPPNEAAPL
ncbi:ParB/RepB/Spo0J family partition protein [Nocardia barduliensis]|uniref:ParB/RepB/Spo0J family partition protein n=1 Tax=Nocardia barduliensis TaxID=2736643 RepID=UPI0015717698|nr:ParB N-terminal domain-containing protein [Nocardia barduliensis]